MKRTALIILLALANIIGFAQEDEMIDVVVLMKSQYNRTELCRKANVYASRAERRDFVVNELKAFTEASQHDLRLTLDALEHQGLVSKTYSLWSANALCFSAKESVIASLSERNDIEYIGPIKQYQLIPEVEVPRAASASREITPNLTQVNADQVWELGYTGAGVVIAVVDSGVNYDHLDLADHLWDGGDEFPHHGYDIVNGDDDPMDDNGHGTHVAGIVCGDGTSGSQTGVAPDATLMCVKSTAVDGFGGAVNIAGGMEWAVEHGCDVISMSLGMAGAEIIDKEILRRTCETVLDAGIIAAVCAGNEGLSILQLAYPIPDNVRVPASCPPPYLDPDQLVNPGNLSCILAIGAVDGNDVAADFTSQGPVTWQSTVFGDYAYNPGIGLIRPDVCAPGVDIKSLDYANVSGYRLMSGTSQATPCIGGIIALMLQKNPDLMPDEICHILEETSLKLTPTKSNITGVGRVDALAALNAVPTWTGVVEPVKSRAMIYPNPSSSTFTIQCEGMTQIEVFGMDGRLLKSINAESPVQQLDGLMNGTFLVKIITDDLVIVSKIVKL